MKWQGVLAGVPDLVIVTSGGRVHFLEVKTEAGRLSADQRAVHERLVALGTPAAIVRSIDDARLAFAAWGIGTREAGRRPTAPAPPRPPKLGGALDYDSPF